MTEYIQINPKMIVAGLGVGIIASLWAIIPFFIPGVRNLLYLTVIAGAILLLLVSALKKDKLLQSGVAALITFVAVSYLVVPAVSGLLYSDAGTLQTNTEGMAKLELAVPDMFCQGCAYSVGTALQGIPGVVSAKADLNTKSAVVFYDPAVVSSETILANDVVRAYGGYANEGNQ